MRNILILLFLIPVAANAQTGFQRQLDSLNGLFCLEQIQDGTFWVGTFLGKIVHLDAQGNFLNGFSLHRGDTASARFVYDLERAPDGGLWALYDRTNGNFALDDYLLLARLDANGVPLWQTTVHYGEVLHWAHNRMVSDPEGNVYVMSLRSDFTVPGVTNPNHLVLVKVSPAGQVLWKKEFDNNGVNYPRCLRRLSDGSLLICGNVQNGGASGFILRLSPEGSILFSQRFGQMLFKTCAEMPEGSLVFAATLTGPLPQAACVVRTDGTGNVLWARQLQMPYALNWIPDMLVNPAGDILIGNYETPLDQPSADLIALSPEGALRWAYRYDLCHNYGVNALIRTKDNGLAMLRYRPGGHLFLKTDQNGICSACPAHPIDIPFTPASSTSVSLSWEITPFSAPNPSFTDFDPIVVGTRGYCGFSAPVAGISLSEDTICRYGTVLLSASGSGSADSYQWRMGGGSPSTSNGPNPGLVQFPTQGDAPIQLVTKSGFCRDTFNISVAVLEGPAPIDLGQDTVLCGMESRLSLDASVSGGIDYFWNDGFTEPEREISTSGQYIVEASNGICSTIDTIAVQILDQLRVNLFSDTTICGHDTIWLDASTPQATRYQWNDGVEIALRPVFASGIYAVTVFQGDCAGSDLVSVDLFPAPPPLPSDTVLCAGQALQLNVGSSLAGQIRWNGTLGSANYSVTKPGWVHRELQYRQCYFSDSVLVRVQECQQGFALYAPNVFRPGSSLGNDVFTLFGEGLELQLLQVYDRWGNLVYRSTDGKGWDGGNWAAGTYVWMARLRQGDREGWLSGDVLLLR